MIGPSFGEEIATAGLAGLPFSWGTDGVYGRENLTPEQNAALDAVIAAHDPNRIVPPPAISDRQFFHALAKRGLITGEEAKAAVKTGEIPAALQVVINNLPPEYNRFDVEMLISGATVFERHHPTTQVIASTFGWSREQTDEFWRFAATL